MNYDSLKDTQKHIAKVNDYIGKCIIELDERGINHDSDKINDDVEKTLFDEYDRFLTFGVTESELERTKQAYFASIEQNYKNKDKTKK